MVENIKILNGPHDDLWHYAQRVMTKGLFDMRTPVHGLRMFGDAVCVVIDREEQYQAELCIFPPRVSVPSHNHPDVDGIEIQITGSIRFFINGKGVACPDSMVGLETLFHKVGFRIPAGQDHSGVSGQNGVAFLSVQRWNNGKTPDHIGHNWSGHHYSDDQKLRLDGIKNE